MSTGLLLDGVFASEAIDSSGEILDVKGIDISDFDEGKGVANYEHQGHDNENNQGQEIVGKVVFAKKIYSSSDCSNDREKLFWGKVKIPFLYGIIRLYDGAGHEGAKALAAIIRDSHANNEPIIVGFSIEGSTLEKDSKTNRLKTTIARRVALTLRPCNKTAVSGLLADPNAPEGYDKNPVAADLLAMVPTTSTKKGEHIDPRFVRLGGSEAIYGTEISKAMAAGNYNAAPGTLTGGAALQVEDQSRKHRALALAAFRDWNRVTPFKKFLKARLPEASDEFLDHFQEIIDSHIFRVKKAEEVLREMAKAGKKPAKLVKPPEPKPSTFTVQGRPVNAPPEKSKLGFDNGVLTTRQGIFQASTPSNPHPHLMAHTGKGAPEIAQHFQDELADRRTHHQRAMRNWFVVNDRFSKGDIHPGVVSHAVAFALMSPGIPVPMQEFMYGHFMDQLHSQGLTHADPAKWDETVKGWMARNRTGLPKHSNSHYTKEFHDPSQNAFTSIEKELTTQTGAMQGFNKPNQFAKYFGDYLQNHHNDVVQSIRDAKGDAHKVARRLTDVRGIAPKLSRYLLGMMGAGNMVVPDTHFIRHYFGSQPIAPGSNSSVDSETQEHLKNSLLSSSSSHDLLEGIDKHYYQNHDAVKAVLNDPAIGPYFKGREEQSVFPAFWWHWISIPGHERRIGTPHSGSSNAETDHAPFWDAVNPLLKKAETPGAEYDPELHFRTAMQHHRWLEQYGPVHALGLYYRYLVPKLTANEAKKGEYVLRRFEELQVDMLSALRKASWHEKAQRDYTKSVAKQAPEMVEWKGKKVQAGVGYDTTQKKLMRVLDMGTHEIAAVPDEHFPNHTPEQIVRYPRSGSPLAVEKAPFYPESGSKVSLKEHGVGDFNHHPDSQALGEGFDFAKKKIPFKSTEEHDPSRAKFSFWSKAPNGKKVYVKSEPPWVSHHAMMPEARQEGTYSNLARDFFGLGKYVPPVAVVRHPKTGVEHAIIEHRPGEEYQHRNPAHNAIIRAHGDSGELDKLHFMNKIMGNSDRHSQNYLVDPKTNSLSLIDHNIVLNNQPNVDYDPFVGHYFQAYNWLNGGDPSKNVASYAHQGYPEGRFAEPVHPAALDWLSKLDHAELDAQLRRHEVPPAAAKLAVDRLKKFQHHFRSDPAVSRVEGVRRVMADMAAEKANKVRLRF